MRVLLLGLTLLFVGCEEKQTMTAAEQKIDLAPPIKCDLSLSELRLAEIEDDSVMIEEKAKDVKKWCRLALSDKENVKKMAIKELLKEFQYKENGKIEIHEVSAHSKKDDTFAILVGAVKGDTGYFGGPIDSVFTVVFIPGDLKWRVTYFCENTDEKNLNRVKAQTQRWEGCPTTYTKVQKYCDTKRAIVQAYQSNKKEFDGEIITKEIFDISKSMVKGYCSEKTQAEMQARRENAPQRAKADKQANIKIINNKCEAEWTTDRSMVEYCTREQTTALEKWNGISADVKSGKKMNGEIEARVLGSVLEGTLGFCKSGWEKDFSMRVYCYEQQHTALVNLDRTLRLGSAIEKQSIFYCIDKWGKDYSMAEYCTQQ